MKTVKKTKTLADLKIGDDVARYIDGELIDIVEITDRRVYGKTVHLSAGASKWAVNPAYRDDLGYPYPKPTFGGFRTRIEPVKPGDADKIRVSQEVTNILRFARYIERSRVSSLSRDDRLDLDRLLRKVTAAHAAR